MCFLYSVFLTEALRSSSYLLSCVTMRKLCWRAEDWTCTHVTIGSELFKSVYQQRPTKRLTLTRIQFGCKLILILKIQVLIRGGVKKLFLANEKENEQLKLSFIVMGKMHTYKLSRSTKLCTMWDHYLHTW